VVGSLSTQTLTHCGLVIPIPSYEEQRSVYMRNKNDNIEHFLEMWCIGYGCLEQVAGMRYICMECGTIFMGSYRSRCLVDISLVLFRI